MFMDPLCRHRVDFFSVPPWWRELFPELGSSVHQVASIQLPKCLRGVPPEGLFFGPVHQIKTRPKDIAVLIPRPVSVYVTPQWPPEHPIDLVWVTIWTQEWPRVQANPVYGNHSHLEIVYDRVVAEWFRAGFQNQFLASEEKLEHIETTLASAAYERVEKTRRGLVPTPVPMTIGSMVFPVLENQHRPG